MRWASACLLEAPHLRAWILFPAIVLAVTVGSECGNLVDPSNPECLKVVPSAGKSPLALAAEFRQCLQLHNHTLVGKDFGNLDFGKVIEAKGGAVIVGPVVPKIGSLWFRKNLQKDGTYRPLAQGGQSFQAHSAPDEKPFWVTVIRNPADRMISGYLTVAGALYRAMERRHPECRQQSRNFDLEDMFDETAAKFCRLPKQCREWHFEEFFSEDAAPVVDIHRVSQLNWIAKAAPHIDALVRMEQWVADYESLIRMARDETVAKVPTRAAGWLQGHMPTSPAHAHDTKVLPSKSDDPCAVDDSGKYIYTSSAVLKASALQLIGKDYVRKFLCQDLILDSECLGYPLAWDYCRGDRWAAVE